MSATDLHDDLAAFRPLLGTWEGTGEGDYPTIQSFRYGERIEFTHAGKPVMAYRQRTWNTDTRQPMHTECGFLRPTPAGGAELIIAQPTGITEIDEGTFDGRVLDLRTDAPGLSATAKAVKTVRRRFELAGHTLRYDLWMAFADVPETHHLAAQLRRVG